MAKGKIEAITKRIDLGTLIRSRCLSFLHWLNLWTKSRLVPKWKSLPMVDPPLLRNVSRSLDRICKVSRQVATTKVWSLSIFIGWIHLHPGHRWFPYCITSRVQSHQESICLGPIRPNITSTFSHLLFVQQLSTSTSQQCRSGSSTYRYNVETDQDITTEPTRSIRTQRRRTDPSVSTLSDTRD